MTTCRNCLGQLLEGSRFCMGCGAPAEVSVTPSASGTLLVPPATIGSVARPSAVVTQSALRLSSRTLVISGMLLCLLFFSPFVSRGDHTFSGRQAFGATLPSTADNGAKDGLLLLMLPLAGLVGGLVGWNALQQIARGDDLRRLRIVGLVALLAAVITAYAMGVTLVNISRSTSGWRLEWGFWSSVLTALGMFAGAMGLMGAQHT